MVLLMMDEDFYIPIDLDFIKSTMGEDVFGSLGSNS